MAEAPRKFDMDRLRPLIRPIWFHRDQLFAGTAWTTLLRSWPFRMWSLDPLITKANHQRDAELRQTAFIAAGLILGIVIKTPDGFVVRE